MRRRRGSRPRPGRGRVATVLLLTAAAGASASESPASGTPPRIAEWSAARPLVGRGEAVTRVSNAALLLSGQSGGPIPLRVLVTRRIGGDRSVTAVLELGRDALRDGLSGATEDAPASPPSSDAQPLEVEAFVYLLGEGGRILAAASQRFDLPTDPSQPPGIKLLARLEPDGEPREVRALVRETASGRFGVRAQAFEAPAAALPPLRVWVLEPLADWRVALPEAGSDGLLPPFRFDDGLWIAAAAPVLSADRPVRLALLTEEATEAARSSGAAAGTAEVTLEALDGEPLMSLSSSLLADLPGPWEGTRLTLLAVEPPPVPAGTYALRAGFATSEEDEVRPSRRVSVSVDLEPRSWPGATTARLVPRDSDDGATAPIAPPLHGRAAGYATVLRQVAGGRTAEAARDLMELERTAADDGGALPRLARVQWATLSALGLGDAADREVGSPVAGSSFAAPVFLLHFERIEAYRAEGRTSLADHSAEISRRLALEMARAGDDRALTLLAGDLLRRGRPRTSQDLLRRGLAMGPASADARLLLAMALELEGRYREAVDTLRELLRLQPDHPEARLRLGVNLGRTGKPRRGRELLRRLAEESPPRWIGVVAAQQSALTDLDDRPRAVVPPLREDWVRHDRDQGLGVLLAYALERTGDGTASTQLVESIVWSGRDPSGLSPRVRYARWSAASRLRLERALRERATVERAELAARLGASVPGAATPGEGS